MRIITVTTVATVMLALAACTGGTSNNDATVSPTTSTSSATAPSGNPTDLIGSTFTVTAFTGATGKLLGPVVLTFDEESWGAETPCNSHGGDVTYSPTQLTTANNVYTAVGCPKDLSTQDYELSTFFAANPMWKLDGNELTLQAGDQTITATRD